MLVEILQNAKIVLQECLYPRSADDKIKNSRVCEVSTVNEGEWHDGDERPLLAAFSEEVACGESSTIEIDAQRLKYSKNMALFTNYVQRIEIERITMVEVSICKTILEDWLWELCSSKGEMKMYNHIGKSKFNEPHEVCMKDCPMVATHWVKGISAKEYLKYFFDVQYRMDWDHTLQNVQLIEKLNDETIVVQKVHKRVWPAAPRESLFWSHIRRVDSHKDSDALDALVVCNHHTERPDVPLNPSCARLNFIAFMMCQTVVKDGEMAPSRTYTRDDVGCRIIYHAKVNQEWKSSSVYISEHPRFLERFTRFVNKKTKRLALEL